MPVLCLVARCTTEICHTSIHFSICEELLHDNTHFSLKLGRELCGAQKPADQLYFSKQPM